MNNFFLREGNTISAYKKDCEFGILGKPKGVEGFIQTVGGKTGFDNITDELEKSKIKDCIIGHINNCIGPDDGCLLCTGNEWDKHKNTDGSNFPGVYNLH